MNSTINADIRGHQLTPTQAEAIKRHAAFMRKIADRAVDIPPVLPPSIPHAPEPDPPRMVAPYSFKETWFSMVPPHGCKLSLRQVKEMISGHFCVSMPDLISDGRAKDLMLPRMIAMYLAKELTDKSLPEIGRHFGDRHHTTVLNACWRVPEMMAADPELSDIVIHLRKSLEKLL